MMLRACRILPVMFVLAACGGGGGGGGGGGEPVLEVVKWTPSGDNQVDTVGQLLPKVIRVKVTQDGEVVSGITVNFSGGNLGTPSVVTNSLGIATTTWTLNEVAGPQAVTATVAGAVGSPLTFNATAVPDAPAKLIRIGPDSLAADTGQIFPGFAVKVGDQYENGLVGRWVQWSKTGPITLSTDSIITIADGSSTMFGTAGTTGGEITVTATVVGLTGSPITFHGAVTPAPVTVSVSSNFYSPDSVNISAGSSVRWVWATGTHSVTSIGSPSFTGSDTEPAPFTLGPILFANPGVYQFQCSVHPAQMNGKVVVQ